MTIQGYLRSIEAKTGLTSTDVRARAETKGFTRDGKLRADVRATEVLNWLKADFSLGHGRAMAIYALLKGARSEES
jgi:hypothetical protein